MKDIVILYHASCPDGFAAAYAAWKKFGEGAEYIAVYHGEPVPEGLEGKEVYMLDFSYKEEILLEMERATKRLVVLDHHEGAKEAVEAVKEHVYDEAHSGVGIAWEYFHPGTALPRLLAYVEQNDLWKQTLPNSKEVAGFLSSVRFDFESFDPLVVKAETEEGFKEIVEKGRAYREYFEYVCDKIMEQKELVEFEGYEIYAVNSPRLFRSEVGNRLARIKGPLAVVWYPNHGQWHFSMRGDGTVDLTKIAQKYGGNGHPNSASFRLEFGKPFPFVSRPHER